jgi:probable HAF family extracellular repeat protein
MRLRRLLPPFLAAAALLAGCQDHDAPTAAHPPTGGPSLSSHADGYAISVLPPLPGGVFSQAHAINDRGEVAGVSNGQFHGQRATLWENGTPRNLGILDGALTSVATGINSHGQVAGFSLATGGDKAWLWDEAGGMRDIGLLPGATGCQAHGINDDAQVVGWCATSEGRRAFLWTAGTFTDLGTLANSSAEARAINDAGQVAGLSFARVPIGNFHAFRWQDGEMYDLNLSVTPTDLRMTVSEGYALNRHGHVAGQGSRRAAVWPGDRDSWIDLGLPDGADFSYATGINDAGLVAGYSVRVSGTVNRALLWHEGQMAELPTLGTNYHQALAVNNHGVVVGLANNAAGQRVAVMWSRAPVNRPPVADAGGPYAGVEGSPVSFDGSASSDPDGDALTYTWDFGDGASGTGVAPAHAYADDGEYTVTLTVSDGALSTQAQVAVSIANADPVLGAVQAPASAAIGATVAISAAFTDPGVLDTHTARIFWGDGSDPTPAGVSQSPGSGTVTGGHAYADAGRYTITVEVRDDDGGIGTSTTSITIESPAEPPVDDADLAALLRAIDDHLADGSISDPGIANSLRSLARNAAAALQRGNTGPARNTLNAFLNHLSAQTGKHVSPDAAEDLRARVLAILDRI